ncbi:MAG: OmpA family protein [Calothrix sp. C42_A2020_038]|nr:OmpA family protein [Calothrix sp. C42_A2020_038]
MNQFILKNLIYKKRCLSSIALSLCLVVTVIGNTAVAQSEPTSLRVVVNSNQDGVQQDSALTLREAIEIINGTLRITELSPAEQAQVSPSNIPKIDFNLPSDQTTIALQDILPPLTAPGLIIDGTTQPGYNPNKSATTEINIPVPIIAIKPDLTRYLLRGFTVLADRITIRGLSIYGFTSQHERTASTPPADIFISHKIPEASTNLASDITQLPKDVVIEKNWLGITPDEKMPAIPSAFGVSVFNAVGAKIQRNRISYHDGSAIITSVSAKATQIKENIIVGNGLAGMPDAIRLEGSIDGSQITDNLICANDGSGAFLFKPEGKVEITNNLIKYNGRRLRRAAVYLMGSDNKVINNQISNQAGPGVVVTAFPNGGSFLNGAAVRNLIQNNRFANLEGLSIDLNFRASTDVSNFQQGDGKNPVRTSSHRRLDTGNAAINAPEFTSKQFLLINNKVIIAGTADPGSDVQIYRVGEDGALSQAITNVKTNAKGNFEATLENLQSGTLLSAIASDPRYGTSEPAYRTVILSTSIQKAPQIKDLNPVNNKLTQHKGEIPNCTTPPTPPSPPATPTPPGPIRLRVPNNIHFALDKDFISPASGEVLDKIAAVMNQYPTIVIELQGHTDARASDAYNKDLAFRRARNARNYLIKKGIAPERMTIRSFGERQLKTPGINKLEHAINRRVEALFFDVRGVEIILESQKDDLQIEP